MLQFPQWSTQRGLVKKAQARDGEMSPILWSERFVEDIQEYLGKPIDKHDRKPNIKGLWALQETFA